MVAAISSVLFLVVVAFVTSKPPLTKTIATVRADGGACSLGSVAGSYGVSDSGTIVGVGPRAAVAVLTLDAAGNISGKTTASLNGSVTYVTDSGTFTVNPDCTGTASFSEFDHSGSLIITGTADVVFDDNMREIRFIFTSVALPDGTPLPIVTNGEARKISPNSSN